MRVRSRSVVRLALAAVICAALPASLLAAEIVGSVLRGNAPVGANVSVELKGVAVVRTDGSGRFVISNVRPGVYELRCGNGQPTQVRINDGVNRISCQG
jgi:hypothetical protein